jgi:hypothetical protein
LVFGAGFRYQILNFKFEIKMESATPTGPQNYCGYAADPKRITAAGRKAGRC